MYRRRKNTRKYIYSGIVLAACLLVLGVCWTAGDIDWNMAQSAENVNSETNVKDNMSNTMVSESNGQQDTVSADEKDGTDEDMQNNGIMESNEAYYLVKRSGDKIAVFYCVGTQKIELDATGIVYELLGPEDQKLFDEGIKVSSQEELGALLQDFES